MRGARAIFRRMIACVLLVGASAMNAEAFLPDVHDADAQQAGSTTQDNANHAGGWHMESGADATSESPIPVHSAHIEHCAHSHVLIPASARSPDIATLLFPQADGIAIAMPASVIPQLNQRPPIG